MKKIFTFVMMAVAALTACAQTKTDAPAESREPATVYFIKDIDPQSLVKVFEACGVKPEGKVAVKISTGESEKSHMLDPMLIKDLVQGVNGTIVECCTAYEGPRFNGDTHLKLAEERGYTAIAPVDIMDAEGFIDIPVKDSKWIKFDRVGKNLANYDFLINLAHFKGHQMGGFGGVLKNQSIGVASRDGKAYIHTAGRHDNVEGRKAFDNQDGQDAFLESMAAAAQAVHDFFGGKAVYINVMNNMSVDCDCNGHPADPVIKDMGILASTDPVALDQACLDLVFNHQSSDGDDSAPLKERITSLHGTHTVEHAEKIGLGTTKYCIVEVK